MYARWSEVLCVCVTYASDSNNAGMTLTAMASTAVSGFATIGHSGWHYLTLRGVEIRLPVRIGAGR